MTLVSNDIILDFLAWNILVRLILVSLETLLTVGLCLLLYEYNKLELAFVSITIFSLERAL